MPTEAWPSVAAAQQAHRDHSADDRQTLPLVWRLMSHERAFYEACQAFEAGREPRIMMAVSDAGVPMSKRLDDARANV